MSCSSNQTEAWEFSSFWCTASLLKRVDNGTGNGRAYLEDTQVDFAAAGVAANVGMVLYNLTDGSSGPVTAVDEHRLTATLAGGTNNNWDVGDAYRIVTLDAQQIATVENVLDLAIADIHAAMAAAGACDCTLSSAGKRLIKKLNIVEAAGFYQCPCAKPTLSDDVRQNLLDWAERQLELIRTGKLELCAGATGAEFPAVDWAEQSVNEFSGARIISNAEERSD